MRPNEWLDDEAFIHQMDFFDKYYIQTLTKAISNLVKNIPIPMITSWDAKNKRIYFSIGQDIKHYFPVDVNIYYDDFIFQVDKWAEQYYPQYIYEYDSEVEVEVILSDDEIWKKVHDEGMNLNDVLLSTKHNEIHHIIERGIITRIYITNDIFYFKIGDVIEQRISGVLGNLKPLSIFLKEFRKLETSKEKRKYIFDNSTYEKPINSIATEKVIDYLGMRMFNFFNIRIPFMLDKRLKKLSDRRWLWDNFIVIFENNFLEKDCIDLALKSGVIIDNN